MKKNHHKIVLSLVKLHLLYKRIELSLVRSYLLIIQNNSYHDRLCMLTFATVNISL